MRPVTEIRLHDERLGLASAFMAYRLNSLGLYDNKDETLINPFPVGQEGTIFLSDNERIF
jgi:hypothetical protein